MKAAHVLTAVTAARVALSAASAAASAIRRRTEPQ